MVTTLRAQNTAYTRKIEELENQVFVLQAELDSRRGGPQPPPTEHLPPPPLPETKLKPGQETPQPEAAEPPKSLVDEAAVEYAGAAAEPRSGKRPLLRLWGPGASEDGSISESPAERRRGQGGAARLEADDEPAAGRSGDSSEAVLYQYGMDHLRSGEHGEAVKAFRAFVNRYPRHEYADNAQYWLGECFYHRKEYSMALREFRKVVESFPRGNKVPDALLKLGYSYVALGSPRPAREALHELVRSYPRHPAAGLASAKLVELAAARGSEGGSAAAESNSNQPEPKAGHPAVAPAAGPKEVR
jgi:tol-pal system protein YbgF